MIIRHALVQLASIFAFHLRTRATILSSKPVSIICGGDLNSTPETAAIEFLSDYILSSIEILQTVSLKHDVGNQKWAEMLKSLEMNLSIGLRNQAGRRGPIV